MARKPQQSTEFRLKTMEPTIGLEPMTCRLRIDPVLRMLLCDNDRTRAFWGVFGCSGDPLYSNCTAGYVLIERHDIQNRLFLTPAANRRSLADIFSETTLTESLRKIRVCRIRGDLGNSIHIVGRTDLCRCFVGDEKRCRASSEKYQFTEEWF